MLEFHRGVRKLVSTCHVRLFLDVVIVIGTSLHVLLDVSHSIRFIFSDVQLVVISSFIDHLLSLPMSTFELLSLLDVCLSYSSVGYFICFSVGQIIDPSQSSGFGRNRKCILLSSIFSAFARVSLELSIDHNSSFDHLSLADGNVLWT